MQKAIQVGGPYPENVAWCRAKLALMLFESGALLPAEQLLETALKDAPSNPHVLAAMGRIKLAHHDYPAAIRFYERAVAVSPQHPFLVELGDTYALAGEPLMAQEIYERVVALHLAGGSVHDHGDGLVHAHSPGSGNAELARFYADHDRNLDEALNEAEIAFRKFKNIHVADTLAWCYYKKGQYKQAASVIRKALKWRTPEAGILFHAGMIYAKLGDRAAASKHLYQALNLNPNFHPTHAQAASDTIKNLAEGAIPSS
jgi:tetratricopeptide (TPR) repeat protein